jgi:hypothetical protein
MQYVSTRGFAHFMVKYISKPEPSHIFNVYDGNRFQQHVTARRLGTMEVMFLTLGEKICNSSTSVLYLTSEPPETRPKAIKPVHLLQQDNINPFWDDAILKYFARPHLPEIDNISYDQYFTQYSIAKKQPSQSTQFWLDDLGNYITLRKTHILAHFRHMHIGDGEPYFYQLLLRNHPWRSESEIQGQYTTYRDHYLALHPDEAEALRDESATYLAQRSSELFNNFEHLLDTLFTRLQSIPSSVSELIRMQMMLLYQSPPIHSSNQITTLPPDQYAALDYLTNRFGPLSRNKYPYYFLTGAAGTGKSYVVNLFIQFLQRKKKPYLLLAPTGVAATNINGRTIHSALRIQDTDGHFRTLAFHDPNFYADLRKVECIVIDEISMVPAALMDFMSNTFAQLHCNNLAQNSF